MLNEIKNIERTRRVSSLISSFEQLDQDYRLEEIDSYNRSILNVKDPVIVANNCLGLFIYKWLGLEYETPFIGIGITAKEFIVLLENFQSAMSQDLCQSEELSELFNCPVGKLGEDVSLRFRHYNDFEEAQTKWNKRKDRMKRLVKSEDGTLLSDRMIVIMSYYEDADYDTYKRFDELPFTNKVAFSNKNYPEFSSCFYLEGIEEYKELWRKDDCGIGRLVDRYDFMSLINALGSNAS